MLENICLRMCACKCTFRKVNLILLLMLLLLMVTYFALQCLIMMMIMKCLNNTRIMKGSLEVCVYPEVRTTLIALLRAKQCTHNRRQFQLIPRSHKISLIIHFNVLAFLAVFPQTFRTPRLS